MPDPSLNHLVQGDIVVLKGNAKQYTATFRRMPKDMSANEADVVLIPLTFPGGEKSLDTILAQFGFERGALIAAGVSWFIRKKAASAAG